MLRKNIFFCNILFLKEWNIFPITHNFKFSRGNLSSGSQLILTINHTFDKFKLNVFLIHKPEGENNSIIDHLIMDL
jgi:hypothetical protein